MVKQYGGIIEFHSLNNVLDRVYGGFGVLLKLFQFMIGHPRVEFVWVALPLDQGLPTTLAQHFLNTELGLGGFLQLLFIEAAENRLFHEITYTIGDRVGW